MQSEIINIATLTIDSEGVNKSIVGTKKEIFELQKANSDLRKDIAKNGDATGESTKKFVENEARLKSLNEQYKLQQSAVNEVTLAELKNNKALTESAKSIDQATVQNKELLKVRNQIDTSTKDGQAAIELLNKKINENNEFIKKNYSELEKQKSNVGNYASITDNLSNVLSKQGGIYSTVRKEIEGFRSGLSSLINTFKDINNSVVNTVLSIIGFGNASKTAAAQAATLATGTTTATAATEELAVAEGTATVASGTLASVLGFLLLPITAIIAAGLILYNIFKDYSPVINPIKDAFAALGTVMTVLKTAILDLVTGARSFKEIFSSLASDIKEATVETYKLEGAQRALNKSMSLQEVASARTATKVKELILQSKDLSKSTKERTDLLNKAQGLEEEEFKNRFKNYKKEKELIIDRLANGKSVSEKDKARLRAGDLEFLTSIAKKKKLDSELVEAYRKNQLSREQLLQEDNQIQEKAQNYKNKIIEKQNAKDEKERDKQISKAKEATDKERERKLKALNDSVIVFESEKNTVDQQLAFYKKYYEDLDKLQNGSERIKNASDFSAKVLEITNKTIADELEVQRKAIEEKKTLSLEQKDDLIANADLLKQIETKRVEESLLTEADKFKALEKIQKGYLASVETINKNFDDSEKIRKQEQATLDAVEFEMKLLVIEDQALAESEIRKQILEAELIENKRLIGLDLENKKITAKQETAFKLLEEEKYKKATLAIDKEVAKNKKAMQIDVAKKAIEAAQLIFGESKALAVAEALINTYEGISSALTAPTLPQKIAGVAFASATGFAAVKNILKTEKGTSGGGDSGSTGTSSPTQIFENPARTATVATVNSAPAGEAPELVQTVLVLETLDEVKNQKQVKVNSK